MKPELKTQADRWRYLLESSNNMLKNKFGSVVCIKDGNLFCIQDNENYGDSLSDHGEWTPYHEPMRDEFEYVFYTHIEDKILIGRLNKFIGKRVKIVISEIV